MWVFILSVIACLYVIYRFVKFWILTPWSIRKHFWSQGIPRRYKPMIDEIIDVRRAILADDPMSYHMGMAKKFGHYYHTSFGGVARLFISDPSLIQGILKTNARSYHKSVLMKLILGSVLGYDNLLTSEDNIHAQHRRLIGPVFQHQNINSRFSLLFEITSNFVNKLTTDIHKEMADLTLDIVSGCVFASGMMKNEDFKRISVVIFNCCWS